MVWLTVAGQPFEAVLDTGFEGGLQLPTAWRGPLSPLLTHRYRELTYQLADGSTLTTYSHWLDVELDGETILVETIFLDGDEILLGVDAMRDYRLVIDYPASTAALDRTP